MESHASSLDLDALRRAKLPAFKVTDEAQLPPVFAAALAEVRSFAGNGSLGFMLVNRLCPGDVVPVHVDPLPDGKKHARWYLPLATNDKCLVHTERDGWTFLEAGRWHGPVRYWEPHGMKNGGETLRDYLNVDLVVDPEVDHGA